ncbi:hypothetical protein [Halalkalibacter flavus]
MFPWLQEMSLHPHVHHNPSHDRHWNPSYQDHLLLHWTPWNPWYPRRPWW